MADEPDERRYLTPKFESEFEQVGYYLVEQFVARGRYDGHVERLMAATEWLSEQREQREQGERAERRRTRWIGILGTMVVALVSASFGAIATGLVTDDLETRRSEQGRQLLAGALGADLEATIGIEKERYDFLDPHLKAMEKTDSNIDPKGRPWLMVPVQGRFPVFEVNAGRLGSLGTAMATRVARTYALAYELRAHIALVTSPPLIKADRGQQIRAIADYGAAFTIWQDEAKKLLEDLRD